MTMNDMTRVDLVRKEIIQLNLTTKELIQKVKNCSGPIEELNELNHEGRKKISLLRNNLALLRTLSEEEAPNVQLWLLEEVQKSEEELRATIAAFQKANITALTAIDKANRTALLGNDADGVVRHRKMRDKENLLNMSSNITDQLLSISRLLADSTQRSADTLSTLVTSSATVDSTKEELENTSSQIAQSGKLLAKYGRREKTDKVLVFFAFAFFLACVFYVIQKRLF